MSSGTKSKSQIAFFSERGNEASYFRNKKIVTFQNEQSVSAPHVYAVGDVMDGGNELTPVAIQAARLLARRLYGDSTELVIDIFLIRLLL